MLHSNTDCGQDLVFLREWMNRNPSANPVTIVSESDVPLGCLGFDMARVNVSCKPVISSGKIVPDALSPGWYAVSVNRIYAESGPYVSLWDREPDAYVGLTFRIFRVQ